MSEMVDLSKTKYLTKENIKNIASFVVGLIMGTGYIAIFSGMTIVLQHDHYYRKFVDLHKSPKQF